MSTTETKQRLTVFTMTAMVVGGMVGAGVFSLPRRFGQETGVAGALIAWLIAGTGMLMLAFVFQTLAIRKPNLDAGAYAYAKAGFGEHLGFFSAFGYWASACVGNVTYWVLIMSTMGAIAPGLGDGDTWLAIGISTVAFLLFAAGPKFILGSFIIYAPASILFVMARREQGRRLFSPTELIILAVSIIGAVIGVIPLDTGWITI